MIGIFGGYSHPKHLMSFLKFSSVFDGTLQEVKIDLEIELIFHSDVGSKKKNFEAETFFVLA